MYVSISEISFPVTVIPHLTDCWVFAKDELCWCEKVVGEQRTRREMYSGGAWRWMHRGEKVDA